MTKGGQRMLFERRRATMLSTMSTTKSSWCVLKAELEGQAARVSPRVVVLEPLAPRTERQVAKVWMALEPVSDHLPEVLIAKLLHPGNILMPESQSTD